MTSQTSPGSMLLLENKLYYVSMIYSRLLSKYIKNANIQSNFSGSNTDGTFTTAVSNSFLSPWEEIPWLQIWDNLV